MEDGDGEDLQPRDFFTLVADMELPEGAEAADECPETIAAALIGACPEFLDLLVGKPEIVWLMRFGVKRKAGKMVLGEMMQPRFQGGMAPIGAWLLADKLGALPDFLCVLDLQWWRDATPHQRRALVHHELKHIGHKVDEDGEKKFTDDGDPVWEIQAHDVEEFRDTVRRFGDFAGDVTPFVGAALEGGVKVADG